MSGDVKIDVGGLLPYLEQRVLGFFGKDAGSQEWARRIREMTRVAAEHAAYVQCFGMHKPEACVDAYLDAAGIWAERKAPLFRTIDRRLQLSDRPLHRTDALRMVKRRALAAGLPVSTCNHTFRATGITTYLN